MPKQQQRYCGRLFTDEEIAWIRDLIASHPSMRRREISVRFCQQAGWRKPDGELKQMSCRVAMIRMEKDGLLRLPPPRNRPRKIQPCRQWSLWTAPQPELTAGAGELDLRLELVERKTSVLWNEFIDRYHYLGYTPLPGAQLRYFVRAGAMTVALLGFGAAAWKTSPRDAWIGWNAEQRKRNLHLVVDNARFLILPWVKVRYLASRILGLCARQLPDDWEGRYGYRPVLLETFVEKEKFEGTSYKAAGWICVGQTQGRGKLDRLMEYKLPKKTVWLRPLEKDFRQKLMG